MSYLLDGSSLIAFRHWLERHPLVYRRVETLFWLTCVLFVAFVLLLTLIDSVESRLRSGSLASPRSEQLAPATPHARPALDLAT